MLRKCILLAVAAFVSGHSPNMFLKHCPHEVFQLKSVNDSQVFYLKLHPACNVTFVQSGKDCFYDVLSLHRFSKGLSSAFLEIRNNNSVTLLQEETTVLDSGIEPFTSTSSFTTLKTNNVNGCMLTIGTTEPGNVMFVTGKEEVGLARLFAMMPIFAYRVQNWAFWDTDHWLWPFASYALVLVLIFVKYPPPNIDIMNSLLCMVFFIDIAFPLSWSISRIGGLPTGGFTWVIILARVTVFLWMYMFVAEHEKYPRVWGAWEWITFLLLFAFTTGAALGAYVVVIFFFHRYYHRFRVQKANKEDEERNLLHMVVVHNPCNSNLGQNPTPALGLGNAALKQSARRIG